VPDDFVVPVGLATPGFRLVPIAPHHNDRDYAAWTSSIDHIRATPGFASQDWPRHDMTLTENLAELAMHANHFDRRVGFTYTVIEKATGEIIGCVYIYPSPRKGYDADVTSWVRADRAALDKPLYESVRDWLAAEWPFRSVYYAARPT